MRQRGLQAALALALPLLLSGCTVVAVTASAVSVTASAVGLAAGAAVGTAKAVGKGVGMAADALASEDPPDHGNSGIERPPAGVGMQ